MKSDTIKAAMTVVAAYSASAPAATVTLSASDAAAVSSFTAAGNWSNTAAPTAANDYVVGAGLNLNTPTNQTTNVTFAGNSLSLVDAASGNAQLTLTAGNNLTTTVNNFTLDGGQVLNNATLVSGAATVTLAGNGITLGTAGGRFAAAGGTRTLNVNAPINGTGPLTLGLPTSGNAIGGLIVLNGVDTHTGQTTLTGTLLNNDGLFGSTRANDGTNLSSAGNLFLNSGVLETSASFTRGLGTGPGQVRIGGAVSGFSAVNANVTLALGGVADPQTLVWGQSTFAPQTLVLNNANATHTLTVANAIDLGVATRTIVNQGLAGSSVVISGGLSSETATSGVNFYGRGTTVLPTANAFTGAVTIASTTGNSLPAQSGVVRATASGALGTGLVTIGNGGNTANGRLELANDITLPNAVALPVRTNAQVAVQNLGGNNTLTNTVTIGSGGTYAIFQSDAGTLTLTGEAGAGGVALTSAAGNTRYVTLQGAANGVVSGVVTNAAGTNLAIAKAGAGTWTLSNPANAYVGPTALLAGTLTTNALANGGVPSGIGASTNVAASVVLSGGTLRYTGPATTTDRLFTIGTAGGTLDASGTGPVTWSNPAAQLTADPATNGTTVNGGTTLTITAGPISGVGVGQTITGTGIRANTTVAAVNYVANTITLSQTASANGTGVAITFGGTTPARTLTLAGTNAGDNTISGPLTNSAAGRVLAVAKTGPGTWSLGGASTYTGATTITDGTLKAGVGGGAAGNLLTNAGGVNLGDTAGRLVLDYSAGGVSPVATVKSILAAQYAAAGNSTSGFVAGKLRSATLTSGHTIGYADTGTGVVVRVTLPGDADLDGDVDFSDFAALQIAYGTADTRFDQGNFDYNAVTDFSDFSMLQTNFGQTIGVGVPRPTITAEQIAAVTAFGLAQAVPEPACVALLASAALALSRRRRGPQSIRRSDARVARERQTDNPTA